MSPASRAIEEEGFLPLVEMTESATVSFRRSKRLRNLSGRVLAEKDIVLARAMPRANGDSNRLNEAKRLNGLNVLNA